MLNTAIGNVIVQFHFKKCCPLKVPGIDWKIIPDKMEISYYKCFLLASYSNKPKNVQCMNQYKHNLWKNPHDY